MINMLKNMDKYKIFSGCLNPVFLKGGVFYFFQKKKKKKRFYGGVRDCFGGDYLINRLQNIDN